MEIINFWRNKSFIRLHNPGGPCGMLMRPRLLSPIWPERSRLRGSVAMVTSRGSDHMSESGAVNYRVSCCWMFLLFVTVHRPVALILQLIYKMISLFIIYDGRLHLLLCPAQLGELSHSWLFFTISIWITIWKMNCMKYLYKLIRKKQENRNLNGLFSIFLKSLKESNNNTTWSYLHNMIILKRQPVTLY